MTSTCPRAIFSFSKRRSCISSESEPEGRRKCRSRKRWFTDFNESTKATRPLPCIEDDMEAGPAGGFTVSAIWLVSSPLTCAKPVIERSGMSDFPNIRLPALAGLRRFQFLLEVGELQLVQTPVRPQLRHQVFVSADVGDGAIFDQNNSVGPAHRRKPVRNHEHSAAAHQIVPCGLHKGLRFAVKSRCRLVKNQDG